jgi:hypothetical protein
MKPVSVKDCFEETNFSEPAKSTIVIIKAFEARF